MSVQVKVKLQIFRPDLFAEVLRERFGAAVEVAEGLLDPFRRAAVVEAARQGRGLPAQAWRGPIRGAVARVPRGTPGVSRYGDLALAYAGEEEGRPVFEVTYDAHGTDPALIRQLLQAYARRVALEEARRRGYSVREEKLPDGTIRLHLARTGRAP